VTIDIVLRAFPPLQGEEENEYMFLSKYFFRPTITEAQQLDWLGSQDYLLREIIHKRLDRRKEMVSFVLVSYRHGGNASSQNKYNPAGYRYFVGVVLDEINSEPNKPKLGQIAYFFESAFPFTSVLRDVIVGIFGSFHL
jgi:hypothetical protein